MSSGQSAAVPPTSCALTYVAEKEAPHNAHTRRGGGESSERAVPLVAGAPALRLSGTGGVLINPDVVAKRGQRGLSEALHVTWYSINAEKGRPARGAEG